MQIPFAAVGKGFVGGLVGVVVALLVWHAWTDHVAFHQIVAFINEHGPAIQKLPK